ncbi:hypothetical protein COCON_G00083830 [Conger conger]|uniref:Uroplakin-2 n=1 Tax=Conger conger TaxID=82655 RepID=A0A9Q1DQX7_CONCO|nr:hypothetical protein COCON_G00083830 [Conger conger]
MKNIILIVFVAFFTIANAEFALKLLQNNVLTGNFSNSLILSLPPCSLAGKQVNLQYNSTGTNDANTLTEIFKVPGCRSKRGLISVTENNGQVTLNKELGYQVTNLRNGTEYSFQYIVDQDKSSVLTASTRTATSYTQIDESLPGRSAAMIIITVLLSVAMLLLIVGLIVSILIGNTED